MPLIKLENVSLDYPIYDTVNRSLTRTITDAIPVGGQMKKVHGERTSILALDNINASFETGDRVALLGHNGAGKTTMLKLLAGFYEPTSGTISREGRVSALLNLMAGMDINFNGYENIFLCGKLHGLNHREILQRIDDITEFSGLGSYINIPVRLYSAGMMLRLAFSICTSIDYEILLMDEWVAAGDQEFILKAKQRLNNMIFRSSILIFATHSTDVAEELCNKAIYLEHGKLLMYGEIKEVIAYQNSRAIT